MHTLSHRRRTCIRTATAVLGLGWLAVLLAGCTPALNWREVPVDAAQLTVSLPCKPDHATRSVALGSGQVEISMLGCAAQGAMFALSWLEISDPAQIASTLGLWHDAVRAQLGLPAQPPGTPPEETAFARQGALDLPQSVRMRATGHRPDGSAVQADAVWLAHLRSGKPVLVHAVVYAGQLDPKAADSFIGSIALRH